MSETFPWFYIYRVYIGTAFVLLRRKKSKEVSQIAGLSKGKRGNWNLVSTVALDHVCVHAWRRHVRQCTCACICQKNVYVKLKEKNGDGRLDSACAVVTNTGLKLSLPWLDAGEQGCSGIVPVRPCPVTPFDLSKFQEVRPAWSSLELPKSISHCVRRTVAGSDVLKKGLFGSFPNQVACISKPTRSLSVLHKWNAAGDREIERRRDFFTSSWSAQRLDIWKLSKVIQCRTFSIRTGIYPTHPLPNVVRIFRKVR